MKLNGLDLNKLRIFCAVVESGGYVGASERLGLTRSALSQAMTTLEGQLGQSLFHRPGIRIVPTEDARRLYEDLMRYQEDLEGALDRFHKRESGAAGLLRIGAYLEFTKGKLMPVIESFLLQHPSAQLQFLFDSPSRIEKLLENGKVDLTISIFPHRSRRIESKKLFQEELCLVGRKDLINARPRAKELNQVPVIDYFPSHFLFKRWWAVHFHKAPLDLRVRAYAGSAEMVLEMVDRRLGVGVIPRYLLERAGPSERLHVIEPSSKKLMDYLWINQTKEKREQSIRKLFVKHVMQTLR